MSDGVTPVLRQVVVTARHGWSSSACPVRSWRRSTRVTVLRANALLDVLSCSQLGCISVWLGCGWRIGCSERSCVSRSNVASGTRHSRDVRFRCARSVYTAPLSVVLSAGYGVSSGDDIVYVYECCAESVGYDR